MNNTYVENKKVKKTKGKNKGKRKNKKPFNSNFFIQILNGEILTKNFIVDNLFYICFVVALLILFISKGYYSRQLSKKINKTQKEIGEINSMLVSNKLKFNKLTDRINMTEKLSQRGLKESESGVQVIRIDE